MKDVLAILGQDKVLMKLIELHGIKGPQTEDDVYRVLLRSITGQQLSTKAADTIWNRFIGLFPDSYPATNLLLATDKEELRKTGLSYQKAEYVQNIARFHLENDLNNAAFKEASDEDIILQICSIKGVGIWTAQMLLMFGLGRENVFPLNDLGIKSAMISLYGIQSSGKQLNNDLEEIANHWSPYRTYACRLLWMWRDLK